MTIDLIKNMICMAFPEYRDNNSLSIEVTLPKNHWESINNSIKQRMIEEGLMLIPEKGTFINKLNIGFAYNQPDKIIDSSINNLSIVMGEDNEVIIKNIKNS